MRADAGIRHNARTTELMMRQYEAINRLFPGDFSTPYLMGYAIEVPSAIPDFSASMKCAHCSNEWIDGATFCVFCLQQLALPDSSSHTP